MKLFVGAAVAGALALVAGTAAAQDVSGTPTYGARTLSSGFTPDPLTVAVRSGGGIDVSQNLNNCSGWIARAPDFRLNYTAGTLPLYISAASNADVTLVVNTPDGRWYCDDDSGEGLNPFVSFPKPQSGQYDIWIGTYGRNTVEDARLSISELTHE